ncbi:hypothetical protein SHAb15599_00005 [Acinetobacter phage SH-Ab 15599]|nr:hypothetical protein SHAb15599_00005 [Acinetobacter phage SH-Ab 15599]
MTEANQQAPKKYGMFDVLNNINSTKDRSLMNEHTYRAACSPFSINRALMQNPRTIMIAHVANRNCLIDPEMYHEYMVSAIPKNNSRVKWKKREDKSEHLPLIMGYYKVNEKVALDYLKILTNDQIKVIIKKTERGGRVGRGKNE